MSFRLKTVLGIGIIEGLLLIVLLWSSSSTLKRSTEDELQKRGQSAAMLLNTTAKDAILSSDLATLHSFVQEVMRNPDFVYARIVKQDGTVLASKGDLALLASPRVPDEDPSNITDDVFDVRSYVVEGGVVYAWIELGLSTAELSRLQAEAQRQNTVIALIEMFLVALFSILLGNYLTRELERLGRAARAVAAGELGHQVLVRGNDELAQTIISFNHMSRRVKELYEEQRAGQAKLEDEIQIRISTAQELAIEKLHLEDEIQIRISTAQELANETARMEAILEAARDGIVTIDDQGCVRDFNTAAESLFQLTSSLEGVSLESLFEDLSLKRILLEDLTADQSRWRLSGRRQKQSFPCELSASPLPSAGPDQHLMLLRDITERARLEEDLARERRELEQTVARRTRELKASLLQIEDANSRLYEANRQKTTFLRAMSHELRTPLNGILGFSELLESCKNGELNDRQLEFVRMIRKSGHHQLALVNDLLDLAKIEAGTVGLNIERSNANGLIANAVEMASMGATVTTRSLKIVFEPSHKCLIETDPVKFTQVLLNLLSNAIKFSPHSGTIQVKATVENRELSVWVIDQGEGVPESDRKLIFTEFYQVNRQRDEGLGGTGLGLPITRQILQQLGGHISVEETPGGGSTFWFTHPTSTSKRRQTALIADTETGDEIVVPLGRKILVADDQKINQILIREILQLYNHEVMIAQNGLEAVALTATNHPDLILMDIRMPKMDGLEATRKIRETEFGREIPIIAFSANGDAESVKLHLAAGCDAHLDKPVGTEALLKILRRYLGVGERSGSHA
jgi:PAS domain S-box-containing protein